MCFNATETRDYGLCHGACECFGFQEELWPCEEGSRSADDPLFSDAPLSETARRENGEIAPSCTTFAAHFWIFTDCRVPESPGRWTNPRSNPIKCLCRPIFTPADGCRDGHRHHQASEVCFIFSLVLSLDLENLFDDVATTLRRPWGRLLRRRRYLRRNFGTCIITVMFLIQLVTSRVTGAAHRDESADVLYELTGYRRNRPGFGYSHQDCEKAIWDPSCRQRVDVIAFAPFPRLRSAWKFALLLSVVLALVCYL